MENKNRTMDNMDTVENMDDRYDVEDYEQMYMHNVIADVVDLVQQKGLPFVLASVLKMMEERGQQ